MGARLAHSRCSQNTVLPHFSPKEDFLGPSEEEAERSYKKASSSSVKWVALKMKCEILGRLLMISGWMQVKLADG